jgi:hypothetical protein
MNRSSFLLLGAGAWGLVSGGCRGADEEGGVARVSGALGQPSGDFPSYDERVMLYATNRARMSPAAETWPAYAAVPPLQWSLGLNQSARAHSIDMRDTPCFQHPSCGSATDDTFTRVQRYYTGPWTTLGENIAGGPSDGFGVVHNWIFEIGAGATETGHRDNIFSRGFNLIGNGFAPGGPPRPALNNLWTQDFAGTGTTLGLPKLSDGIHFPGAPAAGASVSFGATYYDAAGAAPSRILAVVDGACTSMALAVANGMARGTPGKGAYEVAIPLAAGCHPYFFLATVAGADVSYPDSGALQVGVGVAAGNCPLFAATRAAGGCNATGGSAGATGGGAAGADGGGAGSGASGGSTGTAGSGGGFSDGGLDGGTDDNPGLGQGGCACAVSSLDPEVGAAGTWLGLTLALALARRRRLSHRDNTRLPDNSARR